MATPEITLHYFAAKGIGEPIRLLLAAGEVPFTDLRHALDAFAQDTALKERLPFGQLPALEVDGVMLAQKDSIARLAARLAGLYPEDPVDAARVDMIAVHASDTLVETVRMILDGVPGAPGTKPFPEAERRRNLGTWQAERLPGALERLERLAAGDSVLASGLSWADVVVFNFYDRLRETLPDPLPGGFPKLEAVCKTLAAHPPVAAWMRAHPDDYPERPA